VGEVAGVAERAVALREVLAQAHLVELVGFGRRTPLLDAVLARLHLAQTEREIGDARQLAPRTPDVLVPTEITVDTEPLRVEDTLEPVRLRDVPERTVLQLAPVAVPAQRHLREIELV